MLNEPEYEATRPDLALTLRIALSLVSRGVRQDFASRKPQKRKWGAHLAAKKLVEKLERHAFYGADRVDEASLTAAIERMLDAVPDDLRQTYRAKLPIYSEPAISAIADTLVEGLCAGRSVTFRPSLGQHVAGQSGWP
ncbi:hypothetical protein M8R20_16555 [Pseudomonas sp. R2.Fl]|nr:hypothetical protein [Pseudomonas sp. R2.Fl]